MPELLKLKEIVNYQAKAVVSQTILDKEAGTVTLFAFDQEQGLSEHSAPYDALVQIIEGQAEIHIARKPYLLQEGEMILLPAGKPHALKARSSFKMLLIMIKSEQ